MPRPSLTNEELQRRLRITVDEYDGIAPMFREFYLVSIASAVSRSLTSWDSYLTSLWKEDDSVTFSHFVAALVHAAAISRFFWPPIGQKKVISELHNARAQTLRRKLGIRENSPMRSRDIRNLIEHYDEKLDLFLLHDPSGPIVVTPIISCERIEDEPVGHVFQFIDPVYEHAIILGQKFSFEGLHKELKELSTKLPRVV